MHSTLKASLRHGIGLALFAAFTAGIIAATERSTGERIRENQEAARLKALYQLAPKESFDNDVLADVIPLMSEEHKPRFKVSQLGPLDTKAAIHVVRKAGEITQFIFPCVAPDGYTTRIQLWVGVKVDGALTGVRVVQHQETPGLGDKIEIKKSDWILQFNGKSLELPVLERWEVKKDGGDFDQLTGATITPRAIVHAVRRTLAFYKRHQTDLLSLAKKKFDN